MELGLKNGTVRICDYDPAWAEEALRTIARLKRLLADQGVSEFEHVGSTAVHGMPAKPIIDIAAAIEDESVVERCRPILEANGYRYFGKIKEDNWLYYTGHPGGDDHTHHLHLVTSGSLCWIDYLSFRDYLRTHPEAAKKYGDMKRSVAVTIPDQWEKYHGLKAPVLLAVREEALQWWNQKEEEKNTGVQQP